MAIDTASKRFSMMGMGNPTITTVIPAGSVTSAQRATFINLYNGLILNSDTTWTIQTNNAGTWTIQGNV